MNPLLRAAIAGLTLVVTSIALPVTASAQGSLTLLKPGPVVLGQQIDVAIRVPRLPADLAERALFIRWYDAAKPLTFAPDGGVAGSDADVSPRPEVSIPNARAVPPSVTLFAPFEKPGTYELRLFVDTPAYNSDALLARLRLNVEVGRAREGDSLSGSIYLKLKDDTFHIRESLDVTVVLPPNRFYQGNNTGPNVVFYPKKLGGKDVPEEKAVQWLSGSWGCDNTCAPLRDLIRIPNSKAPIGYGLATRAKGEPVTVRLQAPAQPGEYEVRLYDRGFSDSGYEDFYLERIKVVVEDVAITPEVLSFVLPRTPASPAVVIRGDRSDDYEAVTALVHGNSYLVLAEFKSVEGAEEPADRIARVEWLVWSLATKSWTVATKEIKLFRKGPWLYVSDPVSIEDLRK
jgi:hypothetical protein